MDIILFIALVLGIVGLFLIAVAAFTPSWRWPAGFMVAIGLALAALLLFSEDDGPGGGLGIAFIILFSVGYAVLAAVLTVGLIWWYRR